MAFRSCLRPLSLAARSGVAAASTRGFHSTRAAFVKVGDVVPDLDVLTEKSPGNTVNLAKEFAKADGLIIGVPGAFSTLSFPSHDVRI